MKPEDYVDPEIARQMGQSQTLSSKRARRKRVRKGRERSGSRSTESTPIPTDLQFLPKPANASDAELVLF